MCRNCFSVIKIRGPTAVWENFEICRILVKQENARILTCFENIAAPVKPIGYEDISEFAFHELSQYDLEFVTRPDQIESSCGKMSVVLQGSIIIIFIDFTAFEGYSLYYSPVGPILFIIKPVENKKVFLIIL